MKKERSEIEEKIIDILTMLNKNGQVRELIKSDLLGEYMNRFVLTKILTMNLPLNNISISELFHVSRLINTLQPRIKLEEYFTDDEMTQAIESKNNIKVDDDPLIELKNVLHSKNNNEDTWVTIVTYRQIYEWMKSGKLIYNMETQRQGRLKKVKNEMIVIPYINEQSVKDIEEAMLKNEFYSNLISFNIAPDHNYKLEYSEVEKTLTIDTDIFDNIAITDGYHRCSGVVRALEVNPNLEGELYLKITNMSIEKAQKFIRQESKTNVQDRDALEKYNPSNKITMFIKYINEMGNESNNILYRKIDMGVNTPNIWILFEVFKEGLMLSGFLDNINDTDSEIELSKMENFIVKFFDKFYKLAKENRIEIEKSNYDDEDDKEYLSDPTFIMGLLITCYQYYGKNEINAEAMDKFLKKFKNTTVNYTYNYPIKQKDRKNMISKFRKLLEG